MVKLKNKAFAGGSVMDVTTNPRSLPTGRSTYLDIEGITPDKETGYHG